ncbi:formate/nitrite transporter family protein [Halococcus sediminicola]|uniref:formate/nitrite transporter family protein n=1 Tax=Halococcus sediminicola TaxID=1264579 RepID=UPI0009AE7871|nr:formate/nitrite transporter family protein [Halococcus sediminicola]
MNQPYSDSSAAGHRPDGLIRERDHVRGPDDARLTLVLYGDFGSSECGEIYTVIEEVREQLGSQLQYVYRHFPLTELHPNAKHAAEAAEAAATQERFWEMYDRLYEHQGAIGETDLTEHAKALELDTEQFAADLDDHRHEERVREDFQEGLDRGVNRAPALFINGERYEGQHTVEALHRALTESDQLSDTPAKMTNSGDRTPSQDDLRETLDQSERGAPAAGSAVRDRFSADEIFQRIVATAHDEFSQNNRLLFLSGLAAGFAMSLSFVGTASLTALISGDGGSASAAGYLLYPLGFVFVVLGSYQLFTENTITPVTLVMTRVASVPALLRVWGIVFTANVLGVALSAYVLANTGVFSPSAASVAGEIGRHFFELSWWDIFWKAVFAGVLIAGMVWLIHAARDTAARVLVIFILTYAVGAAELSHSIVGSAETLYVVFSGEESLWAFFTHYLAPATLGNTVGGVLLVALLNYSQTRNRRLQNRDQRGLTLDWSDWLFGNHIGQPITPSFPDSEDDPSKPD